MKRVIIPLITLMCMVLSISKANAQANNITITANPKATATLAAVCSLAAQNVNFGQLSLPIGSQSATSNITVECTKGSPYTIGLAYGGVYGQGGQTTTIALTSGSKVSGGSACYYGDIYQYVYGSPYCPSSLTTTTTTYSYGKMIGAAKGDSVGYAIQVPNQPSQIWNAGNYNYSSTGTGVNQSIPVVATIVPGQTTNNYPTPDTYLDTVTATVSY